VSPTRLRFPNELLRSVPLAAWLLAAALGLWACEKPPEAGHAPPAQSEAEAESEAAAPEATPEPPAVEAQAPAVRRVRMPTRDGGIFEAEFARRGELPTDFPDDVPVYGDAHPMSAMSAVGHGIVVNLQTDDPPEAVAGFYADALPEAGWEIEQDSEYRGLHSLVARKGNRKATVGVRSGGGLTIVMLTLIEDR
jgi:hypothetical protein